MQLPSPLPWSPLPWNDRSDVIAFCRLLDGDAGRGAQARLVGGVVRDALLGVTASDIDIATPLLPETVMQIAKKARLTAIPTGIAHGTVTIILEQGPVEITTLRRDVSTDGRHATVAFSQIWQDDAARRDFTFNALYAEPQTGALYDYFDGQADLKNGHVRFIGNAADRICEDYLRIMRYFRFHAYYGAADMDGDTLAVCEQFAPRLQGLSRERISQELLRLIMAPRPIDTIKAMLDTKVWGHIVPDVDADSINRLDAVLARAADYGVAAHSMTRLAALLPHDRKIGARVAAKLRLSRKQRTVLERLLSTGAAEADDIIAQAYFHGADLALQMVLLSGTPERLASARDALAHWTKPVFPIGGREIMAAGVAQGPQISVILQAAEREWLSKGCPPITDVSGFLAPIIAEHWPQ